MKTAVIILAIWIWFGITGGPAQVFCQGLQNQCQQAIQRADAQARQQHAQNNKQFLDRQKQINQEYQRTIDQACQQQRPQ